MKKILLVVLIPVLYLAAGGASYYLASTGEIPKLPEENTSLNLSDTSEVQDGLERAQAFVRENLVTDGHVNLRSRVNGTVTDRRTNSEAVSYYLLWNAKAGNKEAFDSTWRFVEDHMLAERGYMMWRLNASDEVETDGANIASDADLRTLKALLIAEDRWGGYEDEIDGLAAAVQEIAIGDGYLLPYAGVNGEVWRADEVWLSYTNFEVFDALANRRGAPWPAVYANMKNASLTSQTEKGLYNTKLVNGTYSYDLDGDGFSVNSLWLMVRNAESGDEELQESARKSLQFYKEKYNEVDGELFAVYSEKGAPLTPYDTSWVYALVGRAAVALGDERFADAMVQELLRAQLDKGAISEGDGTVSQFTIQESILTMQDYLALRANAYKDETLK